MRPSQEQWEIRQMLLERLESNPEAMKLSMGDQLVGAPTHKLEASTVALHEFSHELSTYSDVWNKSQAISELKEQSKQFSEADLVEDPNAPLKALVADTARMAASLSELDENQAGRFVKNFMDNSRGVFSDPRAQDAFSGNSAPQQLLRDAAQTLISGLDNVATQMVGKKAVSTLQQTTQCNAQMNRPRSAFELANNRSFDLERQQKADPFAHLRNKEVKIERNEESKLDYSATLGPK